MLGQILSNTPLWVWAILAFLIYRGIRAASDRETPFNRLFIIPLAMLGLSLQGIVSIFGASLAAALNWTVFLSAATLLAWRFFDPAKVIVRVDRGAIFQQGSWMPLALMMGIFFTKYAVAIMLALKPPYAQHAGFVATTCALYGVFNGIFIGNLLRMVSIYQSAGAAVPALSREYSAERG